MAAPPEVGVAVIDVTACANPRIGVVRVQPDQLTGRPSPLAPSRASQPRVNPDGTAICRSRIRFIGCSWHFAPGTYGKGVGLLLSNSKSFGSPGTAPRRTGLVDHLRERWLWPWKNAGVADSRAPLVCNHLRVVVPLAPQPNSTPHSTYESSFLFEDQSFSGFSSVGRASD
ncbi:predicted protein [Chaetomium globosum CBS 148.51]|uniref:Uncharacterized protein n=1 Tax=Chaetomium globosum (strain ATCC 6205 / CBS 148.51 / DSM 1962 / NBRC 6347 / NRRL 1970) TaxID=306901 RepID=Q2GY32_CHAGB|nr:uncharacterized protein CHGG_07122 [Chaetomium globosum CBS 148.51]EAQ85869.1 predicted protein [Chaetomium globosum CBS 148.51]